MSGDKAKASMVLEKIENLLRNKMSYWKPLPSHALLFPTRTMKWSRGGQMRQMSSHFTITIASWLSWNLEESHTKIITKYKYLTRRVGSKVDEEKDERRKPKRKQGNTRNLIPRKANGLWDTWQTFWRAAKYNTITVTKQALCSSPALVARFHLAALKYMIKKGVLDETCTESANEMLTQLQQQNKLKSQQGKKAVHHGCIFLTNSPAAPRQLLQRWLLSKTVNHHPNYQPRQISIHENQINYKLTQIDTTQALPSRFLRTL